MKRTKWIERQFRFEAPEGWMFNVIERLLGTSTRIKDLTNGLSNDLLVQKSNGKWSIKELIGHLAELEELHEGRLDDFEAGEIELRPADMSNRKTERANYNDQSLQDLLQRFQQRRQAFVYRLQNLDESVQRQSVMHPRLKVPMRPIDLAQFTAEHDDHHLADIRQIIR